MKYHKIIIAIAVLTFVFSAGSVVQAKALSDLDNELPQFAQRSELILESIESGSYDTWRKLVNPNSKIAKKVDNDDFDKFIQARILAREGKYQQALALYDYLRIRLNLGNNEVKNIISSSGLSVF